MRIRRRNEGGRRRFSPLLWLASLIAAALVALGVTGTLAQSNATITNTNNQVETQPPTANEVQMSERLVNPAGDAFLSSSTSGGENTNPCGAIVTSGPNGDNSTTCSAINKLGEVGQPAADHALVPDTPNTTIVAISNDLSERNQANGTLTLHVAPCTDNVLAETIGGVTVAPGDLCSTVEVSVVCTNGFSLGNPIGPGFTLADLGGTGTGVTYNITAQGGPGSPTATVPPAAPVDFLSPGTPTPGGDGTTVQCTITTLFPSVTTAFPAPGGTGALDGFTTNTQPMVFTMTPVTPTTP